MPKLSPMRALRVLTAVAAAVVLFAIVASPAAAAKRSVPHGFYGAIFTDPIEGAPDDVRARAWDKLALAGVESVRTIFYWGIAQNERGGPFRWERSDAVVGAAAARRISVMPTIMGPPHWARQYPNIDQSPPAKASEFATYLRELVRRYGPKGTFWEAHPELPRRPVRHWQIWNEPELTDHWWREGPWLPNGAKRYGELVRASYRAVREVDPGGKIVLGGATNQAWDTLADLYRHAGIRGYFHIAALHMFPGNWRNVRVIVERFRRALDQNGGRRIPIWATEMTWPSAEGRATVPSWANTSYYRNFVTTEKGTASRLKGAYGLLGAKSFRTRYKLERVLWYMAVSSFRDDYIWNYTGLLDLSNLRETPAYKSYQAMARKHEGCSKDTTGRCR